MAAVRTMLTAAREEAAIITTELAATARAGAMEAGSIGIRTAEMEVINPMAVRQMAEMTVKESMGESSILSQHLSLTRSSLPTASLPGPSSLLKLENSLVQPTSTLLAESSSTTSTTSLTSSITSSTASTRSMIAETIEKEMGVSIREAISNAFQTGAEEQAEDLAAVGKAVANGSLKLDVLPVSA